MAERTCQWLAEAIDDARRKWSFAVWAYVFMPDHVHLVVKPEWADARIPEILKAIKSPVASRAIAYLAEYSPEWLSRITRQRGRKPERLFWQSGGGFDRNVTEPKALLAMMDYIHANPVRKRWVERPRDWRWSSAAWFDDGAEIPLAVDPLPKDWLE